MNINKQVDSINVFKILLKLIYQIYLAKT